MSQARQTPPTYLKIKNGNDNHTNIVAANGDLVGRTKFRLNLLSVGVYYADLHTDRQNLYVTYLGPGDHPF